MRLIRILRRKNTDDHAASPTHAEATWSKVLPGGRQLQADTYAARAMIRRPSMLTRAPLIFVIATRWRATTPQ